MQRKTKVDELIENEQKNIEAHNRKIKNLQIACKDIFSSINGKFFLKFLKELCQWTKQDVNINHEQLVYDKAKRDIWIVIRNLVPKDTLAQIEIYCNDEESEKE